MMNTNFAQILVSKLKSSSTNLRFGVLSLVFTFVFLGMGSNSHAQGLSTSNKSINTSVLDGKTFKVEDATILEKLMEAERNLMEPGGDEVYEALATHFIKGISHNIKTTTLTTRDSVLKALVDVNNYSKNFQSPGIALQLATEDVMKLFN